MPTIAALRSQPGFAVYRNTVIKGCVDALQANYPAVARLVGDEWFRAAAAIYVRRAPPSQPCLVDYGDGFAGFLADFAPAAQLPYLPDVARIDRLWTEAHLAPDDAAARRARVAALAAEPSTVLRPNAAARWAWFEHAAVFTIWSHNRAAGPYDDSDFDWQARARCWSGRTATCAGAGSMRRTARSSTPARPRRRSPTHAPRPVPPPISTSARFARLLDAGALASPEPHATTSTDR